MSLYIVARQSGAIPRLLRLRAFSTDIGLDAHGALCLGAATTPLLSIIRDYDQYLLKAVQNGIVVNAAAIIAGQSIPLTPKSEIKVLDYTMTTRVSSSSNESAGHAEKTPSGKILGFVETVIAGMRQRFPLYEGEFSIGSSEEDFITSYWGISPRHLVSRISSGKIEIKAGSGAVSMQGKSLTEPYCSEQRTTVRLEPAGVLISIEPCHS